MTISKLNTQRADAIADIEARIKKLGAKSNALWDLCNFLNQALIEMIEASTEEVIKDIGIARAKQALAKMDEILKI